MCRRSEMHSLRRRLPKVIRITEGAAARQTNKEDSARGRAGRFSPFAVIVSGIYAIMLRMSTEKIVDVVIPSYYPGKRLIEILELLTRQTVPIRCIRIINTEEEGFLRLLRQQKLTQEELLALAPSLRIRHISSSEFDHGATRNQGFLECAGADYVLTMTQDALPAGVRLVEELMRPFSENERLAVSYARQLPNPGAAPEERLSREFNYPAKSCIKSWEDREHLGIKAFFCSNVCAMYRLDRWMARGGFPERAIFNEDMIYACHALQAGDQICYAAEATVYHSHDYCAGQQFHRNFDLGVSQAQNPDVFADLPAEGEGMRYVRSVAEQLCREKRTGQIPGFLARCAARLAGYRLGKSYRRLPKGFVRWCSSNRAYWG